MDKALQLLEEMPCIADAHVHLMDGATMEGLARLLMEEHRVGLAQVMEIRAPVERIASLPRQLLLRAWEAGRPVLQRLASWLLEHYDSVERMHAETLLLLSRFQRVPPRGHRGPGALLLAYGDPEPSRPPEEARGEAERLLAEGAAGLKIISTLHMTWLDSLSVEAAVEAAAARGAPVLVHAGCDPGIWELPAFCSLGNPAKLEPLVKRSRDTVFIIAHLGGYSAAAPGVFTEEALGLAKRYPNVYLDTSAVPLEVIEIAVKSLGSLAAERLLHGSDYPVVEEDTPSRSAARLAAAMLAAGRSRAEIERVLYRNLEELTGASCRLAPV